MRVNAAVVELDPIFAIIGPAVSVVMASAIAVPKTQLNVSYNERRGGRLPAGVIGDRIQPVSVVLMPERRVRRKVRREINLAKRNIHKRVQPTAHIPSVNAETLQVHDEDVGASPQVHLLGGVYIFFAVRAPAHKISRRRAAKAANDKSRLTATDCCPSAAPPPRTLEANFQVSWGQSSLLHRHFLRTRGSGTAVSASKGRWSNQEREQVALVPESAMQCKQRPLQAQASTARLQHFIVPQENLRETKSLGHLQRPCREHSRAGCSSKNSHRSPYQRQCRQRQPHFRPHAESCSAFSSRHPTG